MDLKKQYAISSLALSPTSRTLKIYNFEQFSTAVTSIFCTICFLFKNVLFSVAVVDHVSSDLVSVMKNIFSVYENHFTDSNLREADEHA